MSENKPLLSVVIAAFNCEKYIKETLDSIFRQKIEDIEVIVVDDHSTDQTPAIIKNYEKPVELIRLDINTGGPSKPRNVGLAKAKGEFITVFDADDVMGPGKLQQSLFFLKTHPDIPLVFSDFKNFTNDGKEEERFLNDHEPFQAMKKQPIQKTWYRIAAQNAFDTLMADTFLIPSSTVFRREILSEIGNFNESLPYSEDFDFYIRIAQKYDFGYIDEVLHKRRIHGSNNSWKFKSLQSFLNYRKELIKTPLSKQARKNLTPKLAWAYFSVGYAEKERGNRKQAVKNYWESWKLQKNPVAIKAMLGALVSKK